MSDGCIRKRDPTSKKKIRKSPYEDIGLSFLRGKTDKQEKSPQAPHEDINQVNIPRKNHDRQENLQISTQEASTWLNNRKREKRYTNK